MHVPKPGTPIVIACDASKTGVGYIATTEDGKIIDMGGRLHSKEQAKRPIMQLELMALEYALRKLRTYVFRASHTTVLTDNKCGLGHLKSCKLATNDKAFQYLSKIQEYPATFRYIDTKANVSSL